jgi:hypothetical protein
MMPTRLCYVRRRRTRCSCGRHAGTPGCAARPFGARMQGTRPHRCAHAGVCLPGPAARPRYGPRRGVRPVVRRHDHGARLGPPQRLRRVRTPEVSGNDAWLARVRSRQSAAMTTPGAGFISFAQIQKCITP